ncbi:MAG: divalent-cation tolerance protein CutA [Candidatus Scalindua sp.]|nr:divalent-cation tolerance protein CutA [Candidatus Scalindua sp.]
MANYMVVFITTSSIDEAKNLGRTLVEEKLVACSNILSPVHSIYQWKGELCEGEEALLVLKTKRELFRQIELRVRELHSYDVPEIIAMPIIEGSEDYLSWVESETR